MSKKSQRKSNIPNTTKQNIPINQPNTPAITIPQTPTNQAEKTQVIQLIQNLEKARGNGRVIVYWLLDTARISEAIIIPLYDQLMKVGKQETIDLVLFTRGGDTEIPLRIVTLIREFCKKFNVLIPYRAYSSGTLIAMGADEIVMTPLGVLGPIDPSRTHPLLPKREGAPEAEPISVQDMRHAIRFILETAKPGNDIPYTPEAMAKIVTSLFDKIHPLAIGAIEQTYALAKLIGTKCLYTHMDKNTDKDKINSIVDKLCDDYKSHAYQICRQEAREIGLPVKDALPNVDTELLNLLKFYMSRPMLPNPTSLTTPTIGHKFKMYLGWLDSADLQLRCEADMQIEKDNQTKSLGDKWIPY